MENQKNEIHEKIKLLEYMKWLYENKKKETMKKYRVLREKIIHTDNQIEKLKQELCKNKHL
ncbi:hypothetical protein [Riemerella anatipestifer]|uniref:hypothetical protein n=1 Tax=Riemerella anatipestifer TaxID=34085 RepID=UPI0021F8D8A3|nr:hypothetical protein [Riemerella anatipestifer]MCW0507980.1 hypothetical protein [Riemerella anatipestifer]MDY3524916.1 hypothetical protein [Riemerella anatipestifer]